MKTILVFSAFAVVGIFGDVAPYAPSGWKPQRALLVLPPNDPRPQNDLPPQPVQDEAENLDKVNESVMERLRQELGSDTGVYYVYLPDGRLQKVQYTTAPVKEEDAQQTNYDANNFQQYPDPRTHQQTYNQYRQSSSPTASNTPQGTNQQANHQFVLGTNKHSNQANQQQFSNYQQAQQQFGESRQQQQYQRNQQYSAEQRQQNSDNKEDETGDPNKLLAKYAQFQQQNLTPTSYIASVQFTDVPPVTGPIFAYSPSPLVRVVRYASNYY